MSILFDCIFFIYACLYLPYLVCTRRVYPGFAMRFGVFTPIIKGKLDHRSHIWVHAVSVGEIIVIEGIIYQLQKKYPQYPIVVTVTTKTGYELARERFKGKALVIPSPIDFSIVVSQFIKLIKPKLYIAAETEIWPNLLLALEKRSIPSVIINGRISDKSLNRYMMIRWILKPVLRTVDLIGVQSPLDATRMCSLGALSSSVKVLGNLKFDQVVIDGKVHEKELMYKPEDLVFIAGSTHPGEEEIILETYQAIFAVQPQWKLVIAPRHIERSEEVMRLIQKTGLSGICLSQLKEQQASNKQVMIVDTIGHLRKIYQHGSIVFVGKSLCVGGGHNIIEPASFAKPVIVGPMMENFRDIMRCFKEVNGVIEVAGKEELKERVIELVQDASLRQQWGQRARSVIDQHQGASQRTLDVLERFL